MGALCTFNFPAHFRSGVVSLLRARGAIRWILSSTIILGLSFAPAGATFIFTFDEYGDGFYQLFNPATGPMIRL
jgi:hypothetical protein